MKLPQELLNSYTPAITTSPGKVLIKNKIDIAMYFSIAVLLSFLAIANFDRVPYKNDCIFLGVTLMLYQLWKCFSLEHIMIDMDAKTITRLNANIIVNKYRKIFKVPATIHFTDIEGIYNEVPWGQTLVRKNLVYVTTKEAFKFSIAAFTSETRSVIFENFLHILLSIADEEFKGWDFLHI